MRRDSFDGKDYIKLSEDCVYYAWQNGELTDQEYEKTCRAIGLVENKTDIKKIIGEKFRDFTLEFIERIYKQILQNTNEGHWYWLKDDQVMRIAKEILDEDNKDGN